MKLFTRTICIVVLLVTISACNGRMATTPSPSPLPPSATPTPTSTPTPTLTPTPSVTPTITPTFTPDPTEVVENYMSMLGGYLESTQDVEISAMEIEGESLHMRIQSRGSGRSFLRLTSWQIVQSISQLLQLLGPNTEVLIDVIGSEDYTLELLVLSEDESVGYRSSTDRQTFNAVQEGTINNREWELQAQGYFEEFP